LAAALGLPPEKRAQIVAVAERRALIEERTGAKVREYGQIFKLNPDVSDVARECAVTHNSVSLLVLGAVQRGGGGCACPESVLIRALVTDLVLYKGDAVVMDMKAGIEHLGRATAKGVDVMLVVVEPSLRSVESARHVFRLAAECGLGRVRLVANKVGSAQDEDFLRRAFPGESFVGSIPFEAKILKNDHEGRGVPEGLPAEVVGRFSSIIESVEEERIV
jgi:CO dehydrogenase maturation factor